MIKHEEIGFDRTNSAIFGHKIQTLVKKKFI
jgi:hypothetical protein